MDHAAKKERRVILLALGLAALWPAATASAGGGCHTGASQGGGDTVEMVKACFTPSVLRVDPGTEVTFFSSDLVTHNISASGWGTDRDMLEGDAFKATFAEEGTYPYACMYHYGMTGAIVVGDGTGPASGVPVETTSVGDLLALGEDRANPAPAARSESSPVAGWTLAAGIGLLVGAGTVGLLRRSRPQS